MERKLGLAHSEISALLFMDRQFSILLSYKISGFTNGSV